MKKIDPKKFGLRKQLVLYEFENGDIMIEINRKSRIIMKDGFRIMDIAKKIWSMNCSANITLKTTAPLCSKTKTFLLEKEILIAEQDKC